MKDNCFQETKSHEQFMRRKHEAFRLSLFERKTDADKLKKNREYQKAN